MYTYNEARKPDTLKQRLRNFSKQVTHPIGLALLSIVFLVSPLHGFAQGGGGVNNNPAQPAAPASYSVGVSRSDMPQSTLTTAGSLYIANFAGREDEQYLRVQWGDGSQDTVKVMTLPGYLKSGKTLTAPWTMTHTYAVRNSYNVAVKAMQGTAAGTEVYSTIGGEVRFDTETSLAMCTDRLNNDRDGKVDLYDEDCAPFRSVENTQALCSDGIDNDLSGATDLADPNCAAFIPKENTAAACSDGIDNDRDGKVDLYDADCAAFRPQENTTALCTDGIDNDYDGLVDGRDPDCVGQVPAENTAATCLDGIDNDFDGLADWNDPDCAPFVIPANCPVGFVAFFIPGFGFICAASAGY